MKTVVIAAFATVGAFVIGIPVLQAMATPARESIEILLPLMAPLLVFALPALALVVAGYFRR